MKNRKESTRAAIHNYIKRECARESNPAPTRRNKTPERDTESAVLAWGRSNGFFFHVVESSTYDARLGVKGEAKAPSGMSDVVGNTPTGLSAWVELKAKDRRSTLREHQRRFLERKIDQNCFAVCVDSAERLAQYWKGFCSLKTPKERRAYLLDCLPKKSQRIKPARDDFEAKHGF